MDDLLDAMATVGGSETFLLDLDSGTLIVSGEDTPEPPQGANAPRFVAIPALPGADRPALLAAALAWLATLDVEPAYELRSPTGREDGSPVGLIDLMVLGAPAEGPRLVDGRAVRMVDAASPGQARQLFVGVAADLCAHYRLRWDPEALVGKDRVEIGGARLTLHGRRVELWIEVGLAARRLFAEQR